MNPRYDRIASWVCSCFMVSRATPITIRIAVPPRYSCCCGMPEIFSAAMAHDSKHLIVGRYPSAGVEAGVAPWTLPGKISFQAPIERIQYPDGKVFLEGVGVVPNVKVPLTVETMTADDDPDLNAAAQALTNLTK